MPSHRSNLTLLDRSFKLAFSNIWRNKILSLATTFVLAVILFIFNVILAANFITQDALLELNNKVEITVYLKESTDFDKAQKILADIRNFPGVETIKYLSKEDALLELKNNHPDISTAFDKYELNNPLPASINIKASHPSYHKQISELLNQDLYQAYISNFNSESGKNIETSISKNLLEISNFTNQIIFWLIVIFIVGATLISLNALQLTIFMRKKEISIMKLVGASHWFIRAPFLIESLIYGLSALVFSFLMLRMVANGISIEETSIWSYFESVNFYSIFLAELLITALISCVSASLATHEYLKMDIIEN